MALFDRVIDYSKDIFRNIRGIRESQNLFDDLSDNPQNWEAANFLDMHTHPPVSNFAMIQRAFDYSKNDFIDYPFEHITASRYSNGSIACWYGSESFQTTVYETCYHFMREIQNCWDVFQTQPVVTADRRIAEVHCRGLALDFTAKTRAFPWLTHSTNYQKCQETGHRVANEGHPLLRVPSARHNSGVNLVVFNPNILSNPREYCRLQYVFERSSGTIIVYREGKVVKMEPALALG